MEKINTIIKQCIKGNEEAQNTLYKQYRSKWYMLSLRYGRSKDEAQDIMQEGLVQIFKDLHQFDGRKSNFGTWSNRVLVHAALKYLKKTSWSNTFEEMNRGHENHVSVESVFDQLAAKELTKIISNLPLGYRLVFNMYAIEGYSHKEIAQQLGISEGTSKSQLFKARKMLKTILEKQLTF